MNPDDQCLQWIKDQPSPPDGFNLSVDGEHGIELYTIPWADQTGTRHVTIVVVGAIRASVLQGGQVVEFTFKRHTAIRQFMMALEQNNADKLTNPRVRESMQRFSKMYEQMMELRTHRLTVSP
jgi:hypothetical protein